MIGKLKHYFVPDIDGRSILLVDVWGTVALLVVTVLLAVTQAKPVQILALVVSVVLFLFGCVVFFVGFLRGLGRSRDEEIDMAGLFYLTGSAPAEAHRAFIGWIWVQVAVAVVSLAVCRPPFTALAPMLGFGVIPWWGSVHATFPPRRPPASKKASKA